MLPVLTFSFLSPVSSEAEARTPARFFKVLELLTARRGSARGRHGDRLSVASEVGRGKMAAAEERARRFTATSELFVLFFFFFFLRFNHVSIELNNDTTWTQMYLLSIMVYYDSAFLHPPPLSKTKLFSDIGWIRGSIKSRAVAASRPTPSLPSPRPSPPRFPPASSPDPQNH